MKLKDITAFVDKRGNILAPKYQKVLREVYDASNNWARRGYKVVDGSSCHTHSATKEPLFPARQVVSNFEAAGPDVGDGGY